MMGSNEVVIVSVLVARWRQRKWPENSDERPIILGTCCDIYLKRGGGKHEDVSILKEAIYLPRRPQKYLFIEVVI